MQLQSKVVTPMLSIPSRYPMGLRQLLGARMNGLQVQHIQTQLDELHNSTYAGMKFSVGNDETLGSEAAELRSFDSMSEEQFSRLGRDDAAARKALLSAVKATGQLASYESAVVPLRMRRKQRQVPSIDPRCRGQGCQLRPRPLPSEACRAPSDSLWPRMQSEIDTLETGIEDARREQRAAARDAEGAERQPCR